MAALLDITQKTDERAARRSLRAQIARLETELAEALTTSYPPIVLPSPVDQKATAAPRLLRLGDLERTRDELVERAATTRRRAAEQDARQAQARAQLNAMLADPPAHKGAEIRNADLGLPGCTRYRVLPRLGPLGLLSGWWRVKISSGCPLPGPG
jgi:uncharacterized membrane protein YqiK